MRSPLRGTLARFDLSLIHADVDPCVLADSLVQSAERRFSLCLQGPPGTGKSALVRYLAERLGLEVMQRRASDLMSMWVGETEQQVASAFAEARDAGAFLVFDEADSLLAGLSALTALTPGDFAVVRRKAEILDRLQEPDALTAMLRDECEAKPGRPRAIGFCP